MNDLHLLPEDIQKRSLFDKEIVLNYKDALKALNIIKDANYAFLGWEGFLKFPNGDIGAMFVQGTVSIDQDEGESWNAYSKRGYDFVKETIISERKEWLKNPMSKGAELYFCITVKSNENN